MYKLNLSKNALSGFVPTELGQMTSLSQLSLMSNKLRGTIPTEFGRLTNRLHLLNLQSLIEVDPNN